MSLKHFTLHLDDEDPEDIPIIRYLNRFKRKRKVSNELRNAMLTYLFDPAAKSLPNTIAASLLNTEFGVGSGFQAASVALPVEAINGQAGSNKAIREARRTFLRRS